jgi:hypothetical protein
MKVHLDFQDLNKIQTFKRTISTRFIRCIFESVILIINQLITDWCGDPGVSFLPESPNILEQLFAYFMFGY